ncbi:MAG: hypothetical protein [Wendovervirus sonii]|uniref:TM2 domain-containing protein n=1 Tax=phage Lak_Megaphage_Sonny TaxID=3109229 RepID=A0ABZ0Z3I6_9CAUD|nr:MAG: hypothetical protein [phage Lak_Megaphage_Sonny]
MENKKDIKYWPAVILALVFGSIGLQEFYIGNTVRGILGILFCWTFIPALIALIQVIKWLIWGEYKFNKKYNTDDTLKVLND